MVFNFKCYYLDNPSLDDCIYIYIEYVVQMNLFDSTNHVMFKAGIFPDTFSIKEARFVDTSEVDMSRCLHLAVSSINTTQLLCHLAAFLSTKYDCFVIKNMMVVIILVKCVSLDMA